MCDDHECTWHPKTSTLAIKLYWCPLMKGLRWTSSTPCASSKTGQFNLYKHSRCQPLCAAWWHYGCTASVTLQMYCPLWQYRYTNISDITHVLSLVTVQIYQHQWHYRCTDLSDSKDVLTVTLQSYTDVLTSTPLHTDLTNWLQWQMYLPQWHYGCTDSNHTMDVLYWPQHYNIMDVLTSQHHGCIDLNSILDVLTSTFWMYWLQHSGCTDLNDLYLLTLISCLGLLVFGISLSHSSDVDFADGFMLDNGLGVVAANDTASSFLLTARRLPWLIDVLHWELAQFRQVLPARPLMATNKTDQVSACRHERKDVVLSQISCSSKLPYHSKFISNWILTAFEPYWVT